jgi:hypothetical protein
MQSEYEAIPIPVAARPFACWDFGFETYWVHVCLSLAIVVLSGRGLCDGPIPHLKESYEVCVSVCGLSGETITVFS